MRTIEVIAYDSKGEKLDSIKIVLGDSESDANQLVLNLGSANSNILRRQVGILNIGEEK